MAERGQPLCQFGSIPHLTISEVAFFQTRSFLFQSRSMFVQRGGPPRCTYGIGAGSYRGASLPLVMYGCIRACNNFVDSKFVVGVACNCGIAWHTGCCVGNLPCWPLQKYNFQSCIFLNLINFQCYILLNLITSEIVGFHIVTFRYRSTTLGGGVWPDLGGSTGHW